jgi:hypothetical protein
MEEEDLEEHSESVNVSSSWKIGDYQAPEDEEAEYTDKFPFAIG